MRALEGFQDESIVKGLTGRIARITRAECRYTFMEVCGTHTQAIGRWGLRDLLPENIRLVSGPGCPVCVTPGEYIDNACALARRHGVIIATFGDLVRVPGLETSLEEARADGADVRTLYSPFDVLALAGSADREVVFLAIGFETTIAGIAATIRAAAQKGVRNLFFYLSLRLVPPALAALLADPEVALDGFLLPGHVSVIIGPEGYHDVLTRYGVPGAIVGFEPVDILRGVEALVNATNERRPVIENLYPRAVKDGGNPAALAMFAELFDPADAVWRGIGTIPASGYALKEPYAHLDASRHFDLAPLTDRTNPGCACGDVLRGVILPCDCALFGKTCTPSHPVGPCMVSAEGSCAAFHKYRAQ